MKAVAAAGAIANPALDSKLSQECIDATRDVAEILRSC